MSKENLVMKYERPDVTIVLAEDEDVITSSFEVVEDSEGGWSGFF